MKEDTWYEIWSDWSDDCFSPTLLPEGNGIVRKLIEEEGSVLECQFWAPTWKAAKAVYENMSRVLHELGPQDGV